MRIIILISAVVIAVILIFTLFPHSAADSHYAENGVLDLRDWDFSRDGPAALRGNWAFFWQEFRPPEEAEPAEASNFIKIPSYWNNYMLDGKKLPGSGSASFQLKLLLPRQEEDTKLALKLPVIATSYELYLDGKLHNSAGRIGTSRESSKPEYLSGIISSIENTDDQLLITIHVSNYFIKKGGIWDGITIGEEEMLRSNHEKRLAGEIFLISFIFTMGLYHIGIFVHRRLDRTALFFGIFCLLIALRSLSTGEIFLLKIFPQLSWTVLLKIEYLTFYISLPVFFMYLRHLLPNDFNLKVQKAVQFAGITFSLFVIATPPFIFSHTLYAYQAITGLSGIYIVSLLIRSVIRKRENALILLLGFIFMFLIVINDIFYSNQLIHTGLFLPAGLFIFIFSQSILIIRQSAMLFRTIKMQKDELVNSHEMFERSRLGTILGLAKLAEYRDQDTGTHLERIREYCRLIAIKLSTREEYSRYITKRYINDLYQSAILHDIGKVGVADSILLKKGKLDKEEFLQIKQHTEIGGDAILTIESKIDMKSFLTLGKEIAYYHHEKWDGSGYPKGLRGNEIPLSARITAVADVYDALTSERPYKTAFSHEKAVSIITEGRGSHFDPELVDVFLLLADDFNKIRRAHREEKPSEESFTSQP